MIDSGLVLVEWLDSRGGEGWVRLHELDAAVIKCKSVGWVVVANDELITLAPHLGTNPNDTPALPEQCCGDMTIPRCAITRIRQIKEPRQ